MGVKIIRGSEVTRPSTEPLKSSVLDHATVQTLASFGLRNNEGLWPSYNCMDTLVPTALCPDPLSATAGTPKTFSVAGWTPAFEVSVYGGVQCSAVGLDVADQRAEVARVFGLNEGRGVERALLLNRFEATGSGDPVQWDAPVDVTPTAAVDLKTALALLEGYAATVYAGAPTIHMPRAAASLLNERIVWQGDKAYTRAGSKVAFGGGYDEGLDDGKWDLFATGEVYVEKSEQIDIHSYVIPGDGSGLGSDENGLADNTSVALVERMYRIAVDCFVAKATGTVW